MSETVVKVFICSTSQDLREYREAVRSAILNLGHSPVAMEAFGALPNDPLHVCLAKVAECDAMVCLVAHRYGFVPAKKRGGDGEKSVTRLEVEAGLASGKPVFAFLVDDEHPWTGSSDVHEVYEAASDPKRLARAVKAVQRLRAFKDWLASELTVDRFTHSQDLADKVTASLSMWLAQRSVAPIANYAADGGILVIHPLQPATHFRGRVDLLDRLHGWWTDVRSEERLISLVAVGGAGKTAIASECVRGARARRKGPHCLVWSFYEQPDAEAFLRVAAAYFLGERDGSAGGRLERLVRGFADAQPRMLVIDGLERVQAIGGEFRARGEIEDHQLRTLLRSVADGLGRTRALITTRFPLADLLSYEGSGSTTIELDHLDQEAAISVLRAWGVHGENDTLLELADRVGRHALSTSVLGSFLHYYADGDPSRAPDFELDSAAVDDPQAAKLGRVLTQYAKEMRADELDLLVRLSIFVKGVKLDYLSHLVEAGGDVAATLSGYSRKRLQEVAKRLVRMGLVFAYARGQVDFYTAHPFLRDHFRHLLGVRPEKIHEALRVRIQPSLTNRPESEIRDPALLDDLEELIEHTRLAGHISEALDLYRVRIGTQLLYGQLGDYVRGARLLASFADNGDPRLVAAEIQGGVRADVLNDWGLFAAKLGELDLADSCLRECARIDEGVRRGSAKSEVAAVTIGSLAQLAILRGDLKGASVLARRAMDTSPGFLAQAQLDVAEFFMGHRSRTLTVHKDPADRDYLGCASSERSAMFRLHLARAWMLHCIGESTRALQVIDMASRHARSFNDEVALARSALLKGRVAAAGDFAVRGTSLQCIRDWTARTGDMEFIIAAHLLGAETDNLRGDHDAARQEAKSGIRLASDLGYGLYLIDLKLCMVSAEMGARHHDIALDLALAVESLSEASSYRWAWVGSQRLMSVALDHLGRSVDAREKEKIARRAAAELRNSVIS